MIVDLPPFRLAPGAYYCDVVIGKGKGHAHYDVILETLPFEVMQEQDQSGMLDEWEPAWGVICFDQFSAAWDDHPSDLTPCETCRVGVANRCFAIKCHDPIMNAIKRTCDCGGIPSLLARPHFGLPRLDLLIHFTDKAMSSGA